ncbi:hypothetical protein ACH5RR_001401 [Cinchona calisaya]|uniref:Uncharacterized protein n=1 Tax=Cinchona calisaya TaxID=153742 RepID=A0ABD3B3A8_9GENT
MAQLDLVATILLLPHPLNPQEFVRHIKPQEQLPKGIIKEILYDVHLQLAVTQTIAVTYSFKVDHIPLLVDLFDDLEPSSLELLSRKENGLLNFIFGVEVWLSSDEGMLRVVVVVNGDSHGLGIEVGLVVEVGCYGAHFGVVGKLSYLIHHDEIVEDGIDHDLILHDELGIGVVDFGVGGLG